MSKRLLVLIVIISLILVGCSSKEKESNSSNDIDSSETKKSKIELPDLQGVDSESAKQLILKKSLLPIIEYEYSGTIAKDITIRTEPAAGTKVKEDSRVIIYVSKGAAGYTSVNGAITYYNLSSDANDKWSFTCPQIYQENLYISCNLKPGIDFQLKRLGFGYASLTDTFDNQVPLRLLQSNLENLPEDKKISAGEDFSFYIVIPLSQLDTEFPTHIACKIVTLIDGVQKYLEIRFSMEWDKSDLGIIDSIEELYNVNQDLYSDTIPLENYTLLETHGKSVYTAAQAMASKFYAQNKVPSNSENVQEYCQMVSELSEMDQIKGAIAYIRFKSYEDSGRDAYVVDEVVYSDDGETFVRYYDSNWYNFDKKNLIGYSAPEWIIISSEK